VPRRVNDNRLYHNVRVRSVSQKVRSINQNPGFIIMIIMMKTTLLFFLLALSLMSNVASMSRSEPGIRGNSIQRRLNFGDIKDHLLFEQAVGGSGGDISGFDGGMAHARSLHQHQQNVEAIKATVKAYPPRELQTTQSITFDEFCSNFSVSICSGAGANI
jgi:hypothetical protein